VRSAVSLQLSPSNPPVHATYSTVNNALNRSRDARYARKGWDTLKEESTSTKRQMTRKRMMGEKKSKRDTLLFQTYWQKG
jgi:hypothetical protein